jgi:3-deoxy-D-arabino-heptulosonate 7-phosphate (DAHP) synthase class II
MVLPAQLLLDVAPLPAAGNLRKLEGALAWVERNNKIMIEGGDGNTILFCLLVKIKSP